MPEKSHLKFLNEKQISEIKDFKYNYGPISNEDEDSVPKNYLRMAASFKEDLEKFDTDIKSKYRTKDQSLNIPYDIDFILITFQGTFSIKDTWKKYFNDFGLEASAFYDFGRKGLFAVADREKFQTFITISLLENCFFLNLKLISKKITKFYTDFIVREIPTIKFLENF